MQDLQSSLQHAVSLVVAYKLLVAACGISFPDQESNQGPLHWELRVLATGPPGKSRQLIILNQVKMPTAMAFEDVTSFLEQILVHSYESESESEVAQSCPSLRNPVDCSLPGSSIHG